MHVTRLNQPAVGLVHSLWATKIRVSRRSPRHMAAAPIQHTESQKNTKQAAEAQFSSVIQLERLNLHLQSIVKVVSQ